MRIVAYASSKGAKVIIEPHNFARYYGSHGRLGAGAERGLRRLLEARRGRYASDSHVMFNLVNEPHDINSEQWVGAANAAIAAIRAAGAHNTVVVPGNAWTGAHAWYDTLLRNLERRRDARTSSTRRTTSSSRCTSTSTATRAAAGARA